MKHKVVAFLEQRRRHKEQQAHRRALRAQLERNQQLMDQIRRASKAGHDDLVKALMLRDHYQRFPDQKEPEIVTITLHKYQTFLTSSTSTL